MIQSFLILLIMLLIFPVIPVTALFYFDKRRMYDNVSKESIAFYQSILHQDGDRDDIMRRIDGWNRVRKKWRLKPIKHELQLTRVDTSTRLTDPFYRSPWE